MVTAKKYKQSEQPRRSGGQLVVLMTPDEREEIRTAAEDAGIGSGTWLRMVGLREARKAKGEGSEEMTTTTTYHLFPDNLLIKVVGVEAFRFSDGKWVQANSFRMKVTGIDGTCDFEDLTAAEARRRFPEAFATLTSASEA